MLLLLNIVNPSETPTAADYDTVYNVIQDVLGEWGATGLLVPVLTEEYLSTVASDANYTVGETAADKTTVRPEQVVRAWIREGNVDYVVDIIGQREYSLLADKSETGRPEYLYVSYTTPNATFFLYPVPDAIYSFYFTSIKPLVEPTTFVESLHTTVTLPRAYYNALKYAVALDVAPYFEKQPVEYMVRRAVTAKQQLMSMNLARSVESAMFEFVTPKNTGTILSY